MAHRIVVLDGYTTTPAAPGEAAPAGEPTWEAMGELGTLTVHPRTPDAQVLERIGEADIVLTNKAPLDAATIQNAPKLRYIGVLATGVNVVDCQAARQAGVTVTNIPGYSSDSVAQHVFALLLELASKVAAHDRAVHAGQWVRSDDFSFTVAPTVELAGKTLGIIGLGAIGQRVAQLGAALGMHIAAAHQRSMNEVSVPGVAIDWQPVDELLPKVDALTLHCPLTEQTQGLMNAERLARMKRGSWLINTGRGPLLDEAAVAEALRSGQLGGAGVDVLSGEPPAADNPLLEAPNCIITPHMAWATVEARQRLMGIAVDNVKAFLNGSPKHVVN
jgi:glycerate dehydrogenase